MPRAQTILTVDFNMLTNQPKQQVSRNKENKRIRKSGLIFDRTEFVSYFDGHEDTLTTINAVLALKSCKDVKVITKHWNEENGFLVRILEFRATELRPNGASVAIVVSLSMQRMKLEFNPSKLDYEMRDYLNLVVQNTTNYDDFISFCVSAHISRLDVCYDLLAFDIRDHLFHASFFRKSRPWADMDRPVDEDDYGQKVYPHETIMFGVRGANSVMIYDKAKEDPSAYPEEEAVTRIEYRFRPMARSIYAKDLPNIENCFPRVHIYSIALARFPSAPSGFLNLWRRKGFLEACKIRKIASPLKEVILRECRLAKLPFWYVPSKSWECDVQEGLKACEVLYEIVQLSQRNLDKATQPASEGGVLASPPLPPPPQIQPVCPALMQDNRHANIQ